MPSFEEHQKHHIHVHFCLNSYFRCGHTGEIWKLLLQALPRWKLENTPPPEEKKPPNTECKRKDDKDKERKSTKSDKALGQDKADRDNKARDKDRDKGGDKGTRILLEKIQRACNLEV